MALHITVLLCKIESMLSNIIYFRNSSKYFLNSWPGWMLTNIYKDKTWRWKHFHNLEEHIAEILQQFKKPAIIYSFQLYFFYSTIHSLSFFSSSVIILTKVCSSTFTIFFGFSSLITSLVFMFPSNISSTVSILCLSFGWLKDHLKKDSFMLGNRN